MRKRLTLRRETLAELTADDLMAVAGGDATGGCPRTMRVGDCLGQLLSFYQYCGTGQETTAC